MTVGELFDQWLAARRTRETTATGNRHTRDKQLGPIADYPAREVTEAHITQWYISLMTCRYWLDKNDKGVKESSAQTALRHLRAAYNWGRKNGLVANQPVHIPTGTRAVETDNIPTLEEIQLVIDHVRTGGNTTTNRRPQPLVADMLQVALMTGMRVSEITGLLVREIDYRAGVIRVRKQASATAPRRRVDLKTAASRRDIPIADELVPVLQRHTSGRAPDEILFPAKHGGFINYTWAGAVVCKAAKRAGATRVHFHALRHYYASALITAGVPVQDVAYAMGHHSAALTLSVYTHVIGDSRGRVSAALNEIFCGQKAGTPPERPPLYVV